MSQEWGFTSVNPLVRLLVPRASRHCIPKWHSDVIWTTRSFGHYFSVCPDPWVVCSQPTYVRSCTRKWASLFGNRWPGYGKSCLPCIFICNRTSFPLNSSCVWGRSLGWLIGSRMSQSFKVDLIGDYLLNCQKDTWIPIFQVLQLPLFARHRCWTLDYPLLSPLGQYLLAETCSATSSKSQLHPPTNDKVQT